MEKFYILKRSTEKLVNEYFAEISGKHRIAVSKRIDYKKPLILMEKTICGDDIERYTDMWFLDESSTKPWYKLTKGRLMWDYTGIVYPLVHVNGTVLTFEQYEQLRRK